MHSISPSPLKGIAFKLISCFLFTCMAALVRELGQRYPTGQIVFCRNFFALLIIGAVLLRADNPRELMRTHRPFGHFYRAFSGVMAIFCMFMGLRYLPLPDATAISYAQPIFCIVFAAILLKEHVPPVRWLAVALGLSGVLIMLWPYLQYSGVDWHGSAAYGAMYTFIGAILAALALTQVRALAKTERASTIVLYFTLFATLLSALALPFGFEWPLNWFDALKMAGVGLIGGVGQMFLTQSYRYADASLVAPFDYSTMIYATLLGMAFFGEYPSVLVLIGASIVIASGMLVAWWERKK